MKSTCCRTLFCLGWAVLVLVQPAVAEPAQEVAAAKWFRHAKLGMFIDWQLALGCPCDLVEDTFANFRPERFDAEEWIALARHAGVRYVAVAARVENGFCLFDSQFTSFDAKDSAIRRDLIGETIRAARRQGLKVILVYSLRDQRQNALANASEPASSGRPQFALARDQLFELCANYGTIDGIWMDVGSEPLSAAEAAEQASIVAMIRELQPDILVNDHAADGVAAKDVPSTGLFHVDGTPRWWERRLELAVPVAKTSTQEVPNEPAHQKLPSRDAIIRLLVDIASKGGNLSLGIGPQADGSIHPEIADRFREVGSWIADHKQAIFATGASPFDSLPFDGRVTVGAERLNVIVFDWPKDGRLRLPGLTNLAISGRLLASDADAVIRCSGRDILITGLPAVAPDPVASVVTIELTGPPRVHLAPVSGAEEMPPAVFVRDAQ